MAKVYGNANIENIKIVAAQIAAELLQSAAE